MHEPIATPALGKGNREPPFSGDLSDGLIRWVAGWVRWPVDPPNVRTRSPSAPEASGEAPLEPPTRMLPVTSIDGDEVVSALTRGKPTFGAVWRNRQSQSSPPVNAFSAATCHWSCPVVAL